MRYASSVLAFVGFLLVVVVLVWQVNPSDTAAKFVVFTRTPTDTPTETPETTGTATATATPTPAMTATSTTTPTATATAPSTSTPTATAAAISTSTPPAIPTAMWTGIPTLVVTDWATATASGTPTRTFTATPTPTPSPTTPSLLTEQVPLIGGVCNPVANTYPNSTTIAAIAAAVSPPGLLEAIWRFAPDTALGYSPFYPEVTDLTAMSFLDVVIICIEGSGPGAGTFTRPLV
jgi:hypothetical protein